MKSGGINLNKRKVSVIISVFFILILSLFLWAYMFTKSEKNFVASNTCISLNDKLYKNIGNLYIDDAISITNSIIDSSLKKSIDFHTPSKTLSFEFGELGESFDRAKIAASINDSLYGGNIIHSISQHIKNDHIIDISSYMIIDSKKIDQIIENNFTFVERKPENAELYIGNSSSMEIKKEVYGISLDKQKLKDEIAECIKKNDNHEITIPIISTPPAICEADIKRIMPVDMIASYKSYYGGSDSGRKENIRLGTSLINNVLLKPGEEFEFWKYVGDTTYDRGFKNAGVYENGRVSTGIGGGLCQVSTSLYNASLLADLKITKRASHSLPVSYVPLGLDATVSIGTYTLAFINNTENYILIKTNTDGENLKIDIYSKKVDGKEVKVYSNKLSKTSADAYRDVYIKGNLIKHEYLWRSVYKSH